MTDLEIAQKAQMLPIREVAKKLNISEDDLDPYGKYKAKLPLHLINAEKMKNSAYGRYKSTLHWRLLGYREG